MVGDLTDCAGRSLPAAEARSLRFAALRRLRPANLSGRLISPLTFAGDGLMVKKETCGRG